MKEATVLRGEINRIEASVREKNNEVHRIAMKIKELLKRIPHLKVMPMPPLTTTEARIKQHRLIVPLSLSYRSLEPE